MAKLTTTAEIIRLKKNVASGEFTQVALAELDSTDDATVYTATTGTYGILIPCDDHDSRMTIILTNITSGDSIANINVRLKAGNADVWGGLGDLAITVKGGKQHVLNVDSARYKFISGPYKGYMVITGPSANVKATVVYTK